MSGPVARYKRYADLVLVGLVGCAIWLHKTGFSEPRFGEPIDTIIVAVGTILSYEAIIALVEWAAPKSPLFLKVYWGKDYLAGYWFYTSQNDAGQHNLGVWRIDQDLFGTQFFGFRLAPDFSAISTVRSVTDFERSEGQFDIIAKRTDHDYGQVAALSRTCLVPGPLGRHGLFFYPTRMRGVTTLAGGPKNGLVALNGDFTKVDAIASDQDMVEWLKARFVHDEASGRWTKLAAPAPAIAASDGERTRDSSDAAQAMR
jgi:hypothetical protein